MEGLLDHPLREVLTLAGGIDRCVSEFIRVTDTLLPARAFTRIVPELLEGSRTAAGVPVRPQLLGSDPNCLAENAARLASLGPAGIDLNFGCPARQVNRHRGGAVLLDEPELVGRIVHAVRRAVPAGVPVSAKMRLGYRDASRTVECAQAIAGGGAGELVVHARTQADGYRPPARWAAIAAVREAVAIPVIANGEIWSVDDARQCRRESGCDALMIGRGMVADPGLARAIKADTADGRLGSLDAGGRFLADRDEGFSGGLGWEDIRPLMARYWQLVGRRVAARHRAGRAKQWLHYLRRCHPQAARLYADLRAVTDAREFGERLFAGGGADDRAPAPPTEVKYVVDNRY